MSTSLSDRVAIAQEELHLIDGAEARFPGRVAIVTDQPQARASAAPPGRRGEEWHTAFVTRPLVFAARRKTLAAVAGASIALTASALPVSALIGRLTSLPLGRGSATISWVSKGGIYSTPTSIRGSARGLPILATNRPSNVSPLTSGSLPASLTLLDVKGTIGGAPFTLVVSLSTASLTGGSIDPNDFGRVSGTFRNQSLSAILTANISAHTLGFHGRIGPDKITGTMGAIVHKGTRSSVHATFDLTR